MIWVLLLLLSIGVAAFLLQPFLSGASVPAASALEDLRAQRKSVDDDEASGRLAPDAARKAKDALDRRILANLDKTSGRSGLPDLRTAAVFAVPAVLLLGVAAIYVRVGAPSYQHVTLAEYRAQQAAALPQSLEELVVELQSRLDADPDAPADLYVFLARSYLRFGEFENGLAAFESAIERSGGDTQIIAERDRVIAMLRARLDAPQTDSEAAARIQAMSPEDQAVMIQNMVDGLAARLEQDPRDLQGWLRLIQARIVLGDMEQATSDLQTARAVFADDPEQLALFEPLAAQMSAAP